MLTPDKNTDFSRGERVSSRTVPATVVQDHEWGVAVAFDEDRARGGDLVHMLRHDDLIRLPIGGVIIA